jgi:serine/threonine protein kinase
VSREPGDKTHTVHTFTGSKEEFFKKGLERFLNEAKRLSKFLNSPGVVNVIDVFSENNTAYIAMEFIDGTSLSNVLKGVGKFSEESMLYMFLPIIKTLAKMHAAGIIHRDIAPDNIMLQPDGSAKLIDFGAAIDSAETGDNKSTVALVKHGYAAEEQYDSNHSRQGTWSDVYSICATMYRTLTGNTPPEALERLRGTPLPEITEPVSEKVKNAIYHGMAVSAKDRTQSMDGLLDEISGKSTEPVKNEEVNQTVFVSVKNETIVAAPTPEVKEKKPRSPLPAIAAIAAVTIIALACIFTFGGNNDIEQVNAEITTEETTAEKNENENENESDDTAETETEAAAADTAGGDDGNAAPTPNAPAPETTAAGTTAVTTAPAAPQTTVTTTAPKPNLPPVKKSAIVRPNYSKLKYITGVSNYDDGRVLASTHDVTVDGKTYHAGFFIDYVPNSSLTVGYCTDGVSRKGEGASRQIQINLKSDAYGIVYHAGVQGGKLAGDVFRVNQNGIEWYTENNGVIEDTYYKYNVSANTFTAETYSNNTSIASYLPERQFFSGFGYYWNLDDKEDFRFDSTSKYRGFTSLVNGENIYNYYGCWSLSGAYYQGQYENGYRNGLGMYIWEDEDEMYIGEWVDGQRHGYGLYLYSDGDVYLQKCTNGESRDLEKLKGVKIDISKIARGY